MIRILVAVFALLTGRNPLLWRHAEWLIYRGDVIAEAELIKVQAAEGIA